MAFLNRLKSVFSGQKLDVRSRFELMREAISGTMSQFYMARDRRTGQVVGLKILDAEKTASFEGRFKGLNKPSEGEISVQFDHPYIVRTLEYGTTTDGDQYLVMEYLDGAGLNSSCRTRLSPGRPTPQVIRQNGRGVCRGPPSWFHPPRRVPPQPDSDRRLRDREVDGFRPGSACHPPVYEGGKSHGYGRLHGAGVGAASVHGSTSRRIRFWSNRLRALHI